MGVSAWIKVQWLPPMWLMPHRHNVACRRHIGKMKFKVTNRRRYEEGLCRRGSWHCGWRPSCWRCTALWRKTRGGYFDGKIWCHAPHWLRRPL